MLASELTNVEDFFYSLSVGDRVRVREAGKGTSPGKTRVYRVEHVDENKPRFTGVCGRSVRTIELFTAQSGSRILSWTRAMDSFPVDELELLTIN